MLVLQPVLGNLTAESKSDVSETNEYSKPLELSVKPAFRYDDRSGTRSGFEKALQGLQTVRPHC